MGVNANLIAGLNRTIVLAGTQLRVRYYDPVFDPVYDESIDLLQSGNNLWTSGVVFPVRGTEGSNESVLLAQGKLLDSDKILFVNGSLTFTSGTQAVDIQLGSPAGELYTTIPEGGIMYEAEGIPVYKKVFIRRTGSLI